MSHKGRCFRGKRRTVARKKWQAERKKLQDDFNAKFYARPTMQRAMFLGYINLAAHGF